jgi:hypothetical protein
METLKGKILNYRRYFASGEWRQEKWAKVLGGFPAILFVVHTDELARELHSYSKRLNSNLRFMFTTYKSLCNDISKEYISSAGKRRLVLQERRVKILDNIWLCNKEEGLVSL